MLKELLSTDSQKQVIGFSLTPGIGLEGVVYDKNTNTVLKYGRKSVSYNFSAREIQDYTHFKTAIAELLTELEVPQKSLVSLVLPNVYFDFIGFPPDMDENGLKTAILSKAEEFYVFRKEEPISGYCEIINPDGDGLKRYVYSSFQKKQIDKIKDAFNELGVKLVSVETSYSATLRGLYQTGVVEDVIREQLAWTVMIINTNSYTLMQMHTGDLLECTEVPLAIKSFSADEAYQAIVSSSSQLLGNFEPQKLFIISQTEDISAQLLRNAMYYDSEMVAIDTNKYANAESMFVNIDELLDADVVKSISFSTIGAATLKSDFDLRLNVLADDPDADMGIYFTKEILGEEIDFTKEVINKICIFIICILVVVFGLIDGGIFGFDKLVLQPNVDKLKAEIQELDSKIEAENQAGDPVVEADMNAIIDAIANENVTANNFYDSIATDIPQNVWLTRYYNKSGNSIAIQGIAQSIVDIYEYYKNLRIVSPQSNIKLTELKVVTPDPENRFINGLQFNPETDRLYSFEISNIDIDFTKKDEEAAPPSEEDSVSEDDIIISNKRRPIEAPSEQMMPAGEQ